MGPRLARPAAAALVAALAASGGVAQEATRPGAPATGEELLETSGSAAAASDAAGAPGDAGSADAAPPARGGRPQPMKKAGRRPTPSPPAESGRRRRASGRGSGRKPGDDKYGPTRAAIAILVDLVVLCGGGIGWCLYLECKPEVPTMRTIMLVVLVLSMIADLLLFQLGVATLWMVILISIASVWGGFDAVLRFPCLHSCDSLFTAKQLSLLVLKIVLYGFGFVDLHNSKLWFFSLLLINVIGLPLMYILALPLDERFSDEQMKGVIAVDVDIAARAWRAVATPEGRQQSGVGCRRRWRAVLLKLGQRLPSSAQDTLTKALPWYKKAVQTERGRSV